MANYPLEMALVVAMSIVISKHPAIVAIENSMIDKCQVVFKNPIIRPNPNLFPDNANPKSAPDPRHLIDLFRAGQTPDHDSISSQIGHIMPHLNVMSPRPTKPADRF
jgi:hypothetical protein